MTNTKYLLPDCCQLKHVTIQDFDTDKVLLWQMPDGSVVEATAEELTARGYTVKLPRYIGTATNL